MLTKSQLAQLSSIASMAKGSGITEGKNGGEGFMGSFVDKDGKTHCFKLLTHSNERKEVFKGKTEADVLNANANLEKMSGSLKDDLLSLARSVGLEENIKDLLSSDKNKCKVLMSRKIVAQIAGRIGEAHNKLAREAGQVKKSLLFNWKAVTRAQTEANSSLAAKYWVWNGNKFSDAECKRLEKFPNLAQSVYEAFSTEKISVPKIVEHQFEPLWNLQEKLVADVKKELAQVPGKVSDKSEEGLKLRRQTLAGELSNVKRRLGIKNDSIRDLSEISDEDLKNEDIDNLYKEILGRAVADKCRKAIEAEEREFFTDNLAVVNDYREFFSAIGRKMSGLGVKCKSLEKINGLGAEEKVTLAKLAFTAMIDRGLAVKGVFKQKGLNKVLERLADEMRAAQSSLNEDDSLKSDKEAAEVASGAFATGAIMYVNAMLAETFGEGKRVKDVIRELMKG